MEKFNSDELVFDDSWEERISANCYKNNAPAIPTAGPTSAVGMRTLTKAPMGPPRIGIFFTAFFAMWTAKMPPITNTPRRLLRSKATRFSVSLAKLSNCWNVRRGWRVREELVRIESRMST